MDEVQVMPEVKPKRKYTRKAVEQQKAALSGFTLESLEAIFERISAASAASVARGIVEGLKAAETEKNREANERKEKRRNAMRAQKVEEGLNNLRKWRNCSHMRSHPYSGTSRIAWATQSDGYTRGTCMACSCPFSPNDSELPFPKEMKGWYERMIAVPMTAANNDFVTGMVAAGNPA